MTRLSVALALSLLLASPIAADQSVKSPRTTSTGVVDGVEISIEYGAPSRRDRVIWGRLVPWNEWWMPGADTSTTITTSAPLLVGDLLVPAGAHSIYTIPGEEKFLLTINSRTGQFHTVYSRELDLGRVPMTLRMLPERVEKMTFAVEPDATGSSGHLKLIWDDREYSVAVRAASPR
jgi:hypothetical protein